MALITYDNMYPLGEILIPSGADFTLHFSIKQKDGVNALNLNTAVIKWVLSPFGQESFTVLQLDGTIIGSAGDGNFDVEISPSDTTGFSGKFIQQGQIVIGTKTYKTGKGVVLFSEDIIVSGG